MSKLIHYSSPNGSYILPSGYTRLSYIQSTGSLWVDTGWNPSMNAKIITTFEPLDTNTNTYYPISCIKASNGKLYYECFIRNKSNMVYSTGGTERSYNATNRYVGKLTMIYTSNTFMVNGTSISSVDKPTGTIGLNLYIFGYNNIGTLDSRKMSCKLYEFKMWDNDQLVRNFVPVLKSDGTLGLLDLCNNLFYPKSGGDNFIAGPECPLGFPTSEYCLVEWLWNDDRTAWIELPRTLKPNTVMKAEMQITNSISGTYQQVMGYATSTSWNPYGLGTNNNGWVHYSASVTPSTPPTTAITTVTLTNTGESTEITGSTLGLFKMSGAPGDSTYLRVAIKLLRCLVLEGTTIVMDLIPCYRRSDMLPGVYDIVGRAFYTNTVGKFSLGPSITFGWGEVINSAPNSNVSYSAIPHNISNDEGRMGEKNGSFDFSGTNAYLNTNGLVTGKTYMGWFYTASKPAREVFFADSASGIAFGTYHNGTQAIVATANSPKIIFTLSTWNTGWNHIAVVKSDNGPQLYINGIAQTATSSTNGWTHNGGLWIGARSTFDGNFSGRCQDFKVFDIALNQTLIQQEM